jgi:hypothetical protein
LGLAKLPQKVLGKGGDVVLALGQAKELEVVDGAESLPPVHRLGASQHQPDGGGEGGLIPMGLHGARLDVLHQAIAIPRCEAVDIFQQQGTPLQQGQHPQPALSPTKQGVGLHDAAGILGQLATVHLGKGQRSQPRLPMDQTGHKGFSAARCPLDHHRGQIRRRCRHPLGQFLRRLAGAN